MYLTYDIKGIQQFIFAVPRLKGIVGASSQIVDFDFEAEKLDGWIYSGGGKGAFHVASGSVAALKKELINRATALGCDIEIGTNDDLTQAQKHPQELHSYCPTRLDGHPCESSGRLPVPLDASNRTHSIILARLGAIKKQDGLKELMFPPLRARVEKSVEVPSDYEFDYFTVLSVDDEDKRDAAVVKEADAASFAFGDRSRFSVIRMDGNDIGQQFATKGKEDVGELREVSRALAVITRDAFVNALAEVVVKWIEKLQEWKRLESATIARPGGGRRLILPVRPLILGGDDIALLCHTGYAHLFVERMSYHFSKISAEPEYTRHWEATKGRLTMSAGILNVNASYPLPAAMDYVDALLDNAKDVYRNHDAPPREPTPAAVDWDTVTDTLLDTPDERRYREIIFHDTDLNGQEVRLTQRPYLLGSDGDGPRLSDVLSLAEFLEDKLSNSARARILPNLHNAWAERYEFVASVAKRYPVLWELLKEDGVKGAVLGTSWSPTKDGGRMTSVPDALMLLEEKHRLEYPTKKVRA